jgi:hypothetical protein
MTPAIDTLRRLVSMLETMRPAAPGYLSCRTDAGKYEIGLPDVWTPGAPWTWRHEDADANSTPARHGTARTLYDALDEIMGDIDWSTCQSCHATHDVSEQGRYCYNCRRDLDEEQAALRDEYAEAKADHMRGIREAGL